ncbi:hypothetical protein FGO68_gene3238 [Halteria grandinella]|uniref:Uncharacterized protein n=1 Tax=Halteria grandinella TaxID=5974 RepID=A0A8J8P323_HALGN|nr:hypothetical protein FGO68_gene3238 [Halteria grandinella]
MEQALWGDLQHFNSNGQDPHMFSKWPTTTTEQSLLGKCIHQFTSMFLPCRKLSRTHQKQKLFMCLEMI